MEDNSLLEPTRQIKAAFLHSKNIDSALEEGTKRVAEITGSAAFVMEKNGRVMAGYQGDIEPDKHMAHLAKEGTVAGDPGLEEMVKVEEPLFNAPYPSGSSGGKKQQAAVAEKKLLYTVIPIRSKGSSLGALLLYHPGRDLENEQLILAETTSALAGMVLMQLTVDQEEEDTRNKELAAGAFDSLSYSEVEAIREILKNIDNNESIVVASKIADSLGITRSVIVNALRKFESAGVIESRSLGMKGTYIKVLNPYLLDYLQKKSKPF